MGRCRPIASTRRAGTSRRDFFKRSGSAMALAAVAPLLPAVARAAAREFQHGVASGDPLADRVILWTRVTLTSPKSRIDVGYVVARDPQLLDVVKTGSVRTNASRDWTVKVDVTGLSPATTYYFRFDHRGTPSPIGRTRTVPAGAVDRLRIAVASCSNFAAGYFNAYRRIAQRADLDAVVHLGDYLYEYGNDQFAGVRLHEPANEAITLQDYRQRHAQHKRDPDSQAMHRQHPLIAIWDDHETANGAWSGGAQNHHPGVEGTWAARVAAAAQAYWEWMPVRQPSKAQPLRAGRRFRFGDLVDLFMLEERLGARSEPLAATVSTPVGPAFEQGGSFLDPSRSLLGDAQEAGLVDGLRQSGARWKLLGQGVMFAQLKAKGAPNSEGGGLFLNPEQWDGYQPARDRVFAAIRGEDGGAAIGNLVVLTGDIHSSFAADLTPDPNNRYPAAGGYDAGTGNGSVAVEFVTTSVTSPGVGDPTGLRTAYLRSQNPHLKYVDLNKRGYMLLDVTHQRVVCEWWHVATVNAPDSRQSMAAAFQVLDGQPCLRRAAQTAP